MTSGEFRAYFREFADAAEPDVQAAIARSLVFIDPANTSRWAASAALLLEGQANLVAHFLVTSPAPGSQPGRGANDVVSEDRPTVKFTRDPRLLENQANDPFQGSSYGLQYVYLRDYVVGRGPFVPSCELGGTITVTS